MAGTLSSPRTSGGGMKQDIEDILHKLQDHDDAISRLDSTVEKNMVRGPGRAKNTFSELSPTR
jgi:hypothetical protein